MTVNQAVYPKRKVKRLVETLERIDREVSNALDTDELPFTSITAQRLIAMQSDVLRTLRHFERS